MAAIRKAAVLPVPVRAWPATSRPAKARRKGLGLDGGAAFESRFLHPLEKRRNESHVLEPASEKMPAGPAGPAPSDRLQSLFNLFPMGRTPPFCEREKTGMSDKIVHLSDAGFERDVLESTKPVLVDYWPNGVDPAR